MSVWLLWPFVVVLAITMYPLGFAHGRRRHGPRERFGSGTYDATCQLQAALAANAPRTLEALLIARKHELTEQQYRDAEVWLAQRDVESEQGPYRELAERKRVDPEPMLRAHDAFTNDVGTVTVIGAASLPEAFRLAKGERCDRREPHDHYVGDTLIEACRKWRA